MTTIASLPQRADAGSRGRQPKWSRTAAAALILIVLPVAAETERGIELIERAMALQPNRHAGRDLYRQHCASCHGRSAKGNARTVTPALAGQLPLYLVKQLVDIAEGERIGSDMHGATVRKPLTEPQSIRDITTHLAELPLNSEVEQGDGTQLALGKRAYDGLCAFCHGMRGEGNAEHATPALRGQHYSYLLKQIRLLSVGHRYSVDPTIAETLRMLPYEYITAIADYASRMPKNSPQSTNEPVNEPQTDPATNEGQR